MKNAIFDFPRQFAYEPQIENEQYIIHKNKFILAGMGGSALAASVVKRIRPSFDIIVHRDYGLPHFRDLHDRLVVASSYSGNTEETISAFQEALEKRLASLAIGTGGVLIELAKKHKAPYIVFPDTGIQPRSALGFSALAFCRAMGDDELLQEIKTIGIELEPPVFESMGKELALRLQNRVPLIYTSNQNRAIAYNWKIKLNETGKIPAFCNVIPELNHNEMNGFDGGKATEGITRAFYCILIKDKNDHQRVQKRMEILEKLYKERGISTEVLTIDGKTPTEALFNSLLLADWAALYTAENYGLEAEQVPMIEEFKKMTA